MSDIYNFDEDDVTFDLGNDLGGNSDAFDLSSSFGAHTADDNGANEESLDDMLFSDEAVEESNSKKKELSEQVQSMDKSDLDTKVRGGRRLIYIACGGLVVAAIIVAVIMKLSSDEPKKEAPKQQTQAQTQTQAASQPTAAASVTQVATSAEQVKVDYEALTFEIHEGYLTVTSITNYVAPVDGTGKTVWDAYTQLTGYIDGLSGLYTVKADWGAAGVAEVGGKYIVSYASAVKDGTTYVTNIALK